MSDIKQQLRDLKDRLAQISTKINPDLLDKQIRELEAKSLHPDFWSDPQAAQSIMKHLASLQEKKIQIDTLGHDLAETIALADLLGESEELIKHLKRLTAA